MSPTISEQILRYLRNHSDRENFVSTTKLAELFPTSSRTSINYYLQKLEADGKIRRYKYTSPTGAKLWYIPSTKVGKTLVFDVNGREMSWTEIASIASSGNSQDYKDLNTLMNYIVDISQLTDREKMHSELEYVREQLAVLSISLKHRKGIVDALRNDPALRDVDTLRELVLEKANAQTSS